MTRPCRQCANRVTHFCGEPDVFARMRGVVWRAYADPRIGLARFRQRPEWTRPKWHKFLLTVDAQGRSLIGRAFRFHARRSA